MTRQLSRLAAGLSLFLALAIVILIVSRVVPQLALPGMNQFDEYHTLDRTLAVVRGEWTSVYANHGPSFRKPPLQYWLGALLIGAGFDDLVAMRLVALTFALSLIALTGVLAALLMPRARGTAAATAMLLLAASPLLWMQASAAMLDAGAALFTLITAIGLLLALRRPHLIWIAVAGIWFGALQKAPVGLAVLASTSIALRLWKVERDLPLMDPARRQLRRRAAQLALGLILLWPIFQAVQHGFGAFRTSLVTEMAERFVPTVDEDTVGNGIAWVEWIMADAWLLWIPGLVVTLALPLWLKRGESVVVSAWVLVFFLGVTFADGETYARYLLVVLPFLAAGLAAALVTLLRLPVLPAIAAAGAVAVTGVAGLELNRASPEDVARDAMIRDLRAEVQPQDLIIFCRYYGISGATNIAAVSAWASAGQPVLSISSARDLDRAKPPGPDGKIVGLCTADALEEIAPRLIGLSQIASTGHWRSFTATELR